MKAVILGCGRLGIRVARKMIKNKDNAVIVIDSSADALTLLGKEFDGKILQGDGTSMDTYLQVMEDKPDVFLALTNHDNTNIMAAEIAKQKYKIENVIARVDDPIRAKAFEELGITTFCPTTLSEKRIEKILAKPAVEKGAEDGD